VNWQGRLQAHLSRFRRYPTEAQMRRQEGTPMARITMTRAGVVLAVRLEQSSGHALLDAEALALVQRAQPLPPLPPEMEQATIELVVPLRFQLR
jgi:protein TonB